jgi:hypothetical protein
MKYVLVNARHKHPQLQGVLPMFEEMNSHKLFDFDYHKRIIHEKLKEQHGELLLYVTGLTPLLISVLNYCRLFNIPVVLLHYNSSTNRYVSQSIV